MNKMKLDLLRSANEITYLDLGCSGGLDHRWDVIKNRVNYIGFDPNEEECNRLDSLPHSYQSAKYLPYAVAGSTDKNILYITESLYCTSLLPPNEPWLSRFEFKDLFRVLEKKEVDCYTLDDLVERENISADIFKLDIQGAELPVLRASKKILGNVFLIETESGFTRNYENESVFWEISQFMETNHFIMYDLFLNSRGRDNVFKHADKLQPLWCQAIWIKDYIGAGIIPNEEEAMVALEVSVLLEYYDYAYELHEYLLSHKVFDSPVVKLVGEDRVEVSKNKDSKSMDSKKPNTLKKIKKKLKKKIKKLIINNK